MLQRVAEVITRYNMFARGARVGVAVSGGADSVCLLHLLTELARDWDLSLTVLHLDHGLRGEESRADASFVQALAAQLGWPALVREAHLEAQLETGDNLEQSAREARLAFFRDATGEAQLYCVATAHTRSDQAETVLFRFLRGSGTAGLAGIRPSGAGFSGAGLLAGAQASRKSPDAPLNLVRPLIETPRHEIEAWLRARNLPWREDSSNFTLQFARNRIRRELIPQLERDWNPAIRDTLAQTAEWARAEESYWASEIDRLAAQYLIQSGRFVLVDVNHLSKLPLAVARRLVRRAIEYVKGDLRGIDFLHVESILALAAAPEGHGRVQAPGIDVFRSFEWLRFGPIYSETLADRNYSTPAPVPGIARAEAAGVEISLELLEGSPDRGPAGTTGPAPSASASGACVYNEEMGWLDWDRLSGSLVLRNWRPGDQYQPVGRSRAEKIKALFQEFRIPLWERRHWPVLMDGDLIVWARRFGVAASFAASTCSRRVLQIRESEADRTASIRLGPGAEVS